MWALLLLLAAEPEMIRIDGGTVKIEDSGTGLTQQARVGTFLMGRTEVTQAEYRRVVGLSPSQAKGDARPVENVSWQDAIAYLNRRSVNESLRPCYSAAGVPIPQCNGYRLPTSAEWTLAAGQAKDLSSANLRAPGVNDLQALEGHSTRVAGSGPGLQDLFGNVWEWCEDWQSPEPLLDALRDPHGPALGVERMIRGGSFLTTRGAFNKAFASSLAPDRRSPFTGFRIVRSVTPAAALPAADAVWLAQFQRPADLSLPPVSASIPAIRDAWAGLLGLPAYRKQVPTARVLKQFSESTWNGQLLDLEVEPGWPARTLVMQPVRRTAAPLPVVIVPFYDVDSPAGENLGGHRSGGGVRAFARLAVQRGFMAVAVRWYGEGDAEGYDESVAQLTKRHPGMTGLAKWITDAQRLVDYLASRPDVDPQRIGIIGHSLGGKMALYAAAFEPRIKVVVSSEPGMALGFTNYEAFWYLGKQRPADRDQQELLTLIAPRPFLLIAGESSDGEKSWPFLAAAQPVYPNPQYLGMFNHKTGHSPTPEAVEHGMDWLERFLMPAPSAPPRP
jgi:dienelactone hydrolase